MGIISESEVESIMQLLPANSFVRKWTEYGKHCIPANSIYHVATALSALTQAVPHGLCLPSGTPLRANLYTLLVGPSSKSWKSRAIALMTEDVLQTALPGSKMEVPGSPQAVIDDLQGRSQKLLVYSEFGSALSQAKEGQMAPLKETLVDLYDCFTTGRNKVKKKDDENSGSHKVESPRLSILGGSAQDFLEDFTSPADWTAGFFARWLVFNATPERDMDLIQGDPLMKAALIDQLRDLNGNGLGRMPGVCQGLSPEATQVWKEWRAYLRGNLAARRTGPSSDVEATVLRSPAQALKISMLLGWDVGPGRFGEPWWVTPEYLQPALRITELHLRSVLLIGSTLATDQSMRLRRRVLRGVRVAPTLLGDITRAAKVEKLVALRFLDTLIEEDRVRNGGTQTVHGRTSNFFELTIEGRRELGMDVPEEEVRAIAAAEQAAEAKVLKLSDYRPGAPLALPPMQSPLPVLVGKATSPLGGEPLPLSPPLPEAPLAEPLPEVPQFRLFSQEELEVLYQANGSSSPSGMGRNDVENGSPSGPMAETSAFSVSLVGSAPGCSASLSLGTSNESSVLPSGREEFVVPED